MSSGAGSYASQEKLRTLTVSALAHGSIRSLVSGASSVGTPDLFGIVSSSIRTIPVLIVRYKSPNRNPQGRHLACTGGFAVWHPMLVEIGRLDPELKEEVEKWQ